MSLQQRPPGLEVPGQRRQRLHLEDFLVRSWMSLRRLLWLVAWVFFWLNLWGEPRYERLREALLNHPWRLPKEVTYLFDWIALRARPSIRPQKCGPSAPPKVRSHPHSHPHQKSVFGPANRGRKPAPRTPLACQQIGLGKSVPNRPLRGTQKSGLRPPESSRNQPSN
jgi:hypothetical protein